MNGFAEPRTYNMANKPFSGSPGKHHYDGNQQGQFKPHPPSKLPPPNRSQVRLAHGVRRTDVKMPNQRGLLNGYQSSSDEQRDPSDFIRKPHSSHFVRQQNEEDDGQPYSTHSKVSLPKYAS